MKNLKLFKKENLKKFKIAGSIVGPIALISLSGCKVVKVEDNNISHNIQTNEIIGSIISESTPSIVNSEVPETISTTTTYIESISETTTITIQTTTTQVPETTIITTPITTTTMTTPEPITSTTISTTTSQTTTTKPIETKPITTTQTTTTAIQTIPVETPPIEYNTRTEEIKAYYNSVELNNTKSFTKNNINSFENFVTVSRSFLLNTILGSDENGNICFYNYTVWYNLDTNNYEACTTDSLIEKTILLSLLNEEYINDETLNKILGVYTYEELNGLVSSLPSIIRSDMNGNRHFDYSKIIVDNKLKTLLINIQNSCINGDHKTVESLCNKNFGKYNAIVDLLLIMYATQMDEINNLPTDKTTSTMSKTLIDDMGIYDRLHPKTLVLQ